MNALWRRPGRPPGRLRLLVALAALALPAGADSLRDGLLALERGDLPSARANLEDARKTSPRDGRVWIALAKTYWRLDEQTAAQNAAAMASEVSPEDAAVLQGLAIYYSETNQPLKAARAEAKFSSKAPGVGPARERAAALYFQAAQPLLDAQKFAEAANVLEEAVRYASSDAQLELALGVADYGLRRFDEAAGAFLRAIDLAPDIEQPYAFLGKILDQVPNRLPEATKRFAGYQAAHPESALAYLLHAQALDAQSVEPENALRLLDKSIALNSADAMAHFERGAVLDRLQRFAEAAAEFERAAALAPSNAAAHYRLARDYDRIGRREAAQAEREKHAQLIKAQEIVR
jgi:tetratricopeptide (TPR) repeat protein